MGSRLTHRLPWGMPLAAGLAAALVSCGGNDYYYPSGGYVAAPTTYAVTAKLDGTGKVDIADTVLLPGSGYNGNGFVSVRLQSQTTAGAYQAPIQSYAGNNPGPLVAAMLSPTGNPGLVVVNSQLVPTSNAANTVSVLFPDPANLGGFLAPVALPVGARNPLGVAAGVFNSATNPYASVVVAADSANTVLVFPQAATGGTFGTPVALTVGGTPTAVAVADLNGDGLPDLVATTDAGVVSVLIQNPDGSFQTHVDYAVGTGPVAVAVADLRKMGRQDLIVANYGTSLTPTDQGLSVLLQNADNLTYAPAVTYSTGNAYADSVAVADLNGDGYPDLAVASSGVPGNPGCVSVFIQDGTNPGSFLPAVNYTGVTGPTSVAIADINGDGLPDLVIGDGGLFVRFQLTGQPGIFGPPTPFYQ